MNICLELEDLKMLKKRSLYMKRKQVRITRMLKIVSANFIMKESILNKILKRYL